MDGIVENFFDADAFERSRHLLWLGVQSLIRLVVIAFTVALVIGALVAWARSSRLWLVRQAAIWFVDIARAVPPLVALVIVYYLTPPINGIVLTNFQAAVLTFGLVQGAYVSEIYRGGLAAVAAGQQEAGLALGMGSVAVFRRITVPQVVRVIIPPLTSQATQLVRDSSLAFFIGYQEVVTRAKEAVTLTSNSTPYTAAALFYAVLLIGLQIISSRLERTKRFRTA